MAHPFAIVFAQDVQRLPPVARAWLADHAQPVVACSTADELMALALRGRPELVLFDARVDAEAVHGACARLKGDSYTAVVPAAVLAVDADAALRSAFASGADEVIPMGMPDDEATARLDAMLRRAARDVQVHPSTRLPGAPEIETEIGRRLAAGESFAVCYADLDHFKEYNDRYGYYEGDRVIRILAKILHDVVRGLCREGGFVGHIGGDDFIFIVPPDVAGDICGEIVSVFDALVPYQYSEQDRRAGYYFGKDRRGQLHRVPLMTVSIGVVTNERRRFTHAAQVSELATEMKSYAKTLPGSIFVADRRQDQSELASSTVERGPVWPPIAHE
ncbi:MAG TPA: GGDEF domain-containing protein [Gemmatimonadaceae bacterium]|nr:GGDEF domain-containing protein [Gemmatimonadaceae bacterium]